LDRFLPARRDIL